MATLSLEHLREVQNLSPHRLSDNIVTALMKKRILTGSHKDRQENFEFICNPNRVICRKRQWKRTIPTHTGPSQILRRGFVDTENATAIFVVQIEPRMYEGHPSLVPGHWSIEGMTLSLGALMGVLHPEIALEGEVPTFTGMDQLRLASAAPDYAKIIVYTHWERRYKEVEGIRVTNTQKIQTGYVIATHNGDTVASAVVYGQRIPRSKIILAN
jgi:hypothetical protein